MKKAASSGVMRRNDHSFRRLMYLVSTAPSNPRAQNTTEENPRERWPGPSVRATSQLVPKAPGSGEGHDGAHAEALAEQVQDEEPGQDIPEEMLVIGVQAGGGQERHHSPARIRPESAVPRPFSQADQGLSPTQK